jgi:hypothetical protein
MHQAEELLTKARHECVHMQAPAAQMRAACGAAQVCLLSAQAGGAGLNLIGANRLVLLDPNWYADSLAPARAMLSLCCAT